MVADCSGVSQMGLVACNAKMDNTDAGQSKAASKIENKKKKNLRQEKNREAKSSKNWPGEGGSEVKHSKLGPFPFPAKSSKSWPGEGESEVKHHKLGPFPLPYIGAAHPLEHDRISDVDKESSCPLVPTSIVLKKIQGRTTLLNKAGSSHSRMSSKVTGGRDSDKIYEFDVPQFEGLQQAVLASLHDDFDDSALALTNTVWNTRDIDPVLRQDPFAIFEFGPDEDWFKEPDTDDCAAARGALPCTPRQSGGNPQWYHRLSVELARSARLGVVLIVQKTFDLW